ncbi:MAG TPA: hypothetical protein VKR43_08680 [Bryobacteraceae bacterium]|nr:hypothetical protein [Bryobacteraceae bacterium]
MRLFACFVLIALTGSAQALEFLTHNRPILDAHNCYPYEGKWADRIDRALKNGFPVAIEQDIAWAKGQPVVTHTAKTTGDEPTLRDHFFEHVRPIMEKALAENKRATWPLIVVHFDFKSLEPDLLRAVWDVLGEYEAWLTTAAQTSDAHQLAPFEIKPLLVLTEDADAQEEIFFKAVPAGEKLRVFGSAHTRGVEQAPREQRAHLLATLPPDQLLVDPPTNYRRWWNNSWFEVEEGGQTKAGDWTKADNARLRALVNHAHHLGYWIRFYTLDGFTADESRGWDSGYNFGSRAAVELRWKAAMEAGVNLIATDQYEALGAFMR